MSYSSRVDRELCAVAALAVGVTTALGHFGPSWTPLLLLPPATLALNMVVVNMRDVHRHAFEYTDYPDARIGIGLYLVAAGTALVIAASLLGFAQRRRR